MKKKVFYLMVLGGLINAGVHASGENDGYKSPIIEENQDLWEQKSDVSIDTEGNIGDSSGEKKRKRIERFQNSFNEERKIIAEQEDKNVDIIKTAVSECARMDWMINELVCMINSSHINEEKITPEQKEHMKKMMHKLYDKLKNEHNEAEKNHGRLLSAIQSAKENQGDITKKIREIEEDQNNLQKKLEELKAQDSEKMKEEKKNLREENKYIAANSPLNTEISNRMKEIQEQLNEISEKLEELNKNKMNIQRDILMFEADLECRKLELENLNERIEELEKDLKSAEINLDAKNFFKRVNDLITLYEDKKRRRIDIISRTLTGVCKGYIKNNDRIQKTLDLMNGMFMESNTYTLKVTEALMDLSDQNLDQLSTTLANAYDFIRGTEDLKKHKNDIGKIVNVIDNIRNTKKTNFGVLLPKQ